ncbi:hypothetical protein HZS_956 [Henneguya salminicola]|nr:hypothetical protein HZS_956 [Henneguya salminicola]
MEFIKFNLAVGISRAWRCKNKARENLTTMYQHKRGIWFSNRKPPIENFFVISYFFVSAYSNKLLRTLTSIYKLKTSSEVISNGFGMKS